MNEKEGNNIMNTDSPWVVFRIQHSASRHYFWLNPRCPESRQVINAYLRVSIVTCVSIPQHFIKMSKSYFRRKFLSRIPLLKFLLYRIIFSAPRIPPNLCSDLRRVTSPQFCSRLAFFTQHFVCVLVPSCLALYQDKSLSFAY